ncbi:MAG: M15 family metallopeptidase [Actinomycetota bacterium]
MATGSSATTRRRAFLGIIAALVLAIGAFTLFAPRDEATPPAVPARSVEGDGVGTAVAADAPAIQSPPTYLAWMSGGFPADVRAKARTLEGLESTVVVAGDTRWMTRSLDADGEVVDEPKASFAIPIDAFAVNPIEYAPFLPEELRGDVTDALNDGLGVLSTRSAALRNIGVGGVMEFGGEHVRIGAIAPDEAIGWSELLVSRDVGATLGVRDDRYLLALAEGTPSEQRFADTVGTLLPEGTALRVVKPGGSEFMRVASGVNPPIVLKEVFGEFAARPDADDPAVLTIEPSWVSSHIDTRVVPILGRVTCNEAFFPALLKALREVEREGLSSLLQTYNGCWNARTVARSPTAPPSFHAYGAAIDINAASNAYGAVPTMNERVVAIFERYGFNWGGDFLVPDGMHFEYWQPMEAAA